MATTDIQAAGQPENYDRAKEVQKFDDSKMGVKGLVDSGITSIPRFFVHPPESLPTNTTTSSSTSVSIPVIDLSKPRSIIIDQIDHASRIWGFFQILNHGIPTEFLHRLINSIKSFHEQPTAVKAQHYGRGLDRAVAFYTNTDLHQSNAAGWVDTMQIRLGPTPLDSASVPEICRTEVEEWDRHVHRLGESLMGMLAEGLGLKMGRLKDLMVCESKVMVAHYYPYCPEPDRTVGVRSHMDAVVLTLLLQNMIGGLQVKHGGDWFDVKPIDGALVVNIGDLLQMISNNEYKSVEHRVLANPFREPRISVVVFHNPSDTNILFGPLPELISPQKPAIYQKFTLNEFSEKFLSKGLDGRTVVDYFKL